MSVTIKITLFKGKQLASGEYPIMLDLTKDRKHKYINLGYKARPEEWDDKMRQFKKKAVDAAQRNFVLMKALEKAHSIVSEYRIANVDFTLLEFESKFRGTDVVIAPAEVKKMNFHDFFLDKIDKLRRSQKAGNARIYDEAFKSFFKFHPDKQLRFSSITVELLSNYEVWLRERGGTDGGISVKIRTLRAVYNDAIKKDHVSANDYPFKKYGVNRLKSEGIKKALTRQEVQLIEELDLSAHPNFTLTRHLFVFSYFTRGMNFADMMKLTWRDIEDGKITYIRAKTKKAFVVKVTPPIQEILDYYKTIPSNTNYIFPILLKENLNAQQEVFRKKKVLQRFNKQLKEIAALTGIQKNLSSYVARHSFATNLKHAGVSVTVISESLGHRTQEITETYLKGFDNSVIDDAVDLLL